MCSMGVPCGINILVRSFPPYRLSPVSHRLIRRVDGDKRSDYCIGTGLLAVGWSVELHHEEDNGQKDGQNEIVVEFHYIDL
jgi:hypothetical protein